MLKRNLSLTIYTLLWRQQRANGFVVEFKSQDRTDSRMKGQTEGYMTYVYCSFCGLSIDGGRPSANIYIVLELKTFLLR